MKLNSYPLVSVLTPTLNAGKVLEKCLKSIRNQSYPAERIEIIVADGGSADETLTIAKRYDAVLVENPLKTGEAGKAAALKLAKGDLIALIDSDNILPDERWLGSMVEPLLNHAGAVGSEPWSYTYRRQDGFITRYCALIGMNDPLALYLGNYDRLCVLSGKWTEIPHFQKDYGNYILAVFDAKGLPTIGANGTVFRSEFLKQGVSGKYLFDIDIVAKYIKEHGRVEFIKVKNGIVHTYCERSVVKFARKQRRRVKDFLYHKNLKDREYDWESYDVGGGRPFGLLKFILYCVIIFPLILESVKGYILKPDVAWLFHPLACEITLWEYGWGRIVGVFSTSELDRSKWKQ